MSDFLTRLGQRAIGEQPEVRPDIAPVFPLESGMDSRESADARVAEPPASRENEATRSALESSEEKADAPMQPSPRAPRMETEAVRAAAKPKVREPATSEARPARTASFPGTALPHLSPRLPAKPSNAATVEPRISREPAQPTATQAVAGKERQINIRIGRIEVRAAPVTRTQPTTRHDAPRSDLRSLENYLRERNGGRR